MTPWTLIEPCCGTAALTMAILGARRQLVPRQGSKWSLRKQLRPLFPAHRPERIVLSDSSPWGKAMSLVLSGDRAELLGVLRNYVESGEHHPEALHAALHGSPLPEDPYKMTAELLWLQRMAYAGKAVRVVDGRWSSPGLNLTSAKGVAATDKFGEVKPLGPALLRAVEAAPRHDCVVGVRGLIHPYEDEFDMHVYLDPPYQGRTGYGPRDLTRDQVIIQAHSWGHVGARVIVSEAESIEIPGWTSRRLEDSVQRDAHLQFRANHRAEWITFNSAVEAEAA